MNETIRQYLSSLGKKGGAVRSEKKTIACRLNAKKPRPGRRKKNVKK